MTRREAETILQDYYESSNPTEEERFRYAEALKFLIEVTKESDYMVELGAMYYEESFYDLALKYYEMAAEYNNRYAITDLGYIWYYGRTGEKNYEKAFFYFNKAREMGDLIAAYKAADMYRNGYFVEKDERKYKSIIEELYPEVKKAVSLDAPLPEVYTRLARIRSEEGKREEALELYDAARDFLSRRIALHPFFGDLNIMKWMIADIYKLREFDPEYFELYDLYHVLASPAKVSFVYNESEHEVEAVREGEGLAIRFDDRWFRSIDDFFNKAELEDEHITTLWEDVYDFRALP